ncbi:MAG: AmmeMemoRadiSam system protein B [Candidatus Bathyarchaeota archaeon]|nr:AmmeMemoRadiSam system protein B [Candidatus Termiticorpusculum sp.]
MTPNQVSLFRRPHVAGQFYESNAEALKLQIKSCFLNTLGPEKLPEINYHNYPRNIVGLICPHAGYMYSGAVAASSFFELAKDGLPETIIILCPNHTGYGSGLSLMREGIWQTPLGNIQIDTDLADNILSKSDIIDVDEFAHRFEHSIEVQLPFLQYLYGDNFKIVPICFLMQDFATAVDVGNILVEVLAARNAVVVASSDMTHYESAKQAEKKDLSVLAAVTALDALRFYETVEDQNVTMCGCAPITALITYARGLNAKATLLNYRSSGDVTGDYSSVVGYASVIFKK